MNTYLRHVKVKTSVVCLSRVTTTELKPTTDFTGVKDVSGYRSGIFMHRTIANASGSPDVLLDGGMITSGYTTTLWGLFATLQTDITTTANVSDYSFVEGLPDLIRIRLSNTTTTSSYRGQVSAKLFAQ